MRSLFATYAREFEVLVTRAARRGALDVADLGETYAKLEPSSHPRAANERQLDLDAIVDIITTLPAGFFEAREIRLVRRLAEFATTDARAEGHAAGWAEEGVLLIEAPFGLVSLINLAGSLCALHHEQRKARGLLAAIPHDAPSGAVAFALGVAEAQLDEAKARTHGVIIEWACGRAHLPPVSLHAELSPEAAERRALRTAQGILASLAEMGLANRPLHLWVGPRAPTDLVSPYARELRAVLVGWAAAHPDEIGEDLQHVGAQPSEEVLYALAHDFTQQDARLVAERAEAERTVGIVHGECEGLGFETIDFGRLDGSICDPRLGPLEHGEPAPVLVRLSADWSDNDGVALAALLSALGARVASVTLALEGTVLSGEGAQIVIPHLVLSWAGEDKLVMPGAQPFDAAALASLSDGGARDGVILSAPSPALVASAHVSELVSSYGVCAIDIAGAGLLRSVIDAVARGSLGRAAELGCALVASETARTGRPVVASLQAMSAIALDTVRRVVKSASPHRRSTARSGARSRASVRIKA